MKSFNERYSAGQTSVYETFADLIFCALIVLVLFVMMLAVEVSQRVRSSISAIPEVEMIEDIEELSREEVAELSKKLQRQQSQMRRQRDQMIKQQREIAELKAKSEVDANLVASKIAALNGEQRFTGATEPAKILLAYEYNRQRIVFIRQKEFRHATTQQGGESSFAYLVRQQQELAELALLSRKQRHFTLDEANAIYSSFTKYQQINPTEDSYTISSETLGVTYVKSLSGYIAGDAKLSQAAADEIERVVNSNFSQDAGESQAMYPSGKIVVHLDQQSVELSGVTLSPKDFRDVLLSIGGRGVMLDFEGYSGEAPAWLKRQVLEPTGYIGKTPKIPGA